MAAGNEARRDLLKEFSDVHSPDDLHRFFAKFMTDKEINLIYRRLAVIKFMKQGKKYREIKEAMEISGNTISGVRDILMGRGYGRNPKRKRVFSETKDLRKKKRETFFPKYKGAESII